MTEILKTDATIRREMVYKNIVSLHRSMIQDAPTAKPWAIYRTIGAKVGLTAQAVYCVLKKHNEI